MRAPSWWPHTLARVGMRCSLDIRAASTMRSGPQRAICAACSLIRMSGSKRKLRRARARNPHSSRSEISGLWMVIPLLLASGLPLFFGGKSLAANWSLAHRGHVLTGVIEGFHCPGRRAHPKSSCHINVTFTTPAGQSKMISEGDANPSPGFSSGDAVEVFYFESADESIARVNRPFHLWVLPAFTFLMGMPFLVFAVLMWWAPPWFTRRLTR